MNEKVNEKLNENPNEITKHEVPVLSLKEFVKNEFETGDKKIRGPIKIKKDDMDSAISFFKER
ncbi:MAG: hypothetical protein ACYDEX_19465 [Mobilitalea sp.]